MNEPWYSAVVGRDMAVDLGTANTLVYVRGRGMVLNEPSVVAVNARDGRPLAVGAEAKRMIGRTPSHIQAIRPLKDGVIADFDICEKMLRYFIQRVHPRRWAPPRMVICVPSGITGVEQRAVQEAAEYGRCPQAGLHHRRADGRGDRRGSAGARARRQHDRRHRRRHDRSRGHLARRHRRERIDPHRRRRARRSDRHLREEGVLARARRANGRRDQDRARRARARCKKSSTRRSAVATSSPACRRRSSCRPRRSAKPSRSRSRRSSTRSR